MRWEAEGITACCGLVPLSPRGRGRGGGVSPARALTQPSVILDSKIQCATLVRLNSSERQGGGFMAVFSFTAPASADAMELSLP